MTSEAPSALRLNITSQEWCHLSRCNARIKPCSMVSSPSSRCLPPRQLAGLGLAHQVLPMLDTSSQKIRLKETFCSLPNVKTVARFVKTLMQITACAMLYYIAQRRSEKTKMMQLGRKKGVWATLVLALGFTWMWGRDIATAGRHLGTEAWIYSQIHRFRHNLNG